MHKLPPASITQAANIAEPALRLEQMAKSVEALRGEGTLWYSLLNMIAAYIDGLASGPKGGTRAAYIAYVEKHFPALSAELGATVFYENYRNATIHEFGLRPGYAIGRDSGMGGHYVAVQPMVETEQDVLVLNIDRLALDFEAHIEALKLSAGIKHAP